MNDLPSVQEQQSARDGHSMTGGAAIMRPVRERVNEDSARLHRAHVVGEPLSLLVGIAARELLHASDAVDAEIAKVVPALAPRAYRPGSSPVVERERPHVALARLAARVAVVE